MPRNMKDLPTPCQMESLKEEQAGSSWKHGQIHPDDERLVHLKIIQLKMKNIWTKTSMALGSIFIFQGVSGLWQSQVMNQALRYRRLDSFDGETKISKPLRLEINLIDGILFKQKRHMNLFTRFCPWTVPQKTKQNTHDCWIEIGIWSILGFIHNIDQDRSTWICNDPEVDSVYTWICEGENKKLVSFFTNSTWLLFLC